MQCVHASISSPSAIECNSNRFKRYGKVFRAYLFGHEFVIIGDKALLKGALSSEEDVGFTLPVATANEVMNTYNMSDFHRHKAFVSFVPPWPGS